MGRKIDAVNLPLHGSIRFLRLKLSSARKWRLRGGAARAGCVAGDACVRSLDSRLGGGVAGENDFVKRLLL